MTDFFYRGCPKDITGIQSILLSLDEKFSCNNHDGNPNAPEEFLYVDNNSYVCLSAPHATRHPRLLYQGPGDPIKPSDIWTGALTEYIASQQKWSYIVRAKRGDALIKDFILKKGLEDHFFLDIHGMKDGNGFDLAVGTGRLEETDYTQELEHIHTLANKYGITYVINDRHYRGRKGLTGQLQEVTERPSALQFEFSPNYVDVLTFNAVQKTLAFITELGQCLEKDRQPRKLCDFEQYTPSQTPSPSE